MKPGRADAAVDTNAIEISLGFKGFWSEFNARLGKSIEVHGETNVIVGPISDPNSPSLFIIVFNCNKKPLKNCSVNQLDIQSFILPTCLKYNGDCLDPDDFFNAHLAGLRDVEKITGLHFFPTLNYRDQVDLLARTPLASSILVNPAPSFKEPRSPKPPVNSSPGMSVTNKLAFILTGFLLLVHHFVAGALL